MNLIRIQYFVEAARCENFTEAARKLFTSQPNLSKQIAIMENELGVQLFQRVNRAAYLTQAGQYLFEQLKDIPEITAKAFEQAKALGRGDSGVISVGILEGQDVNINLAARFQALKEKHPSLKFEMERNSFSNLRRGLENCHYDIIITLSFELRTMEGVCSETLIEQHGAVAISRKNPKSYLENPKLSDFKDEDFVTISPEESPGGNELLFEQCSACGFVPRIVRKPNSLESLLLCVETGIGIAVLDRNTRLEKNDDVRIIPLPDSDFANVVAVWLAENHNPVVKYFVEGLK